MRPGQLTHEEFLLNTYYVPDSFLFNLHVNPGRNPRLYSPFTDWEMEFGAVTSHITGLGFVPLSPIHCQSQCSFPEIKSSGACRGHLEVNEAAWVPYSRQLWGLW